MTNTWGISLISAYIPTHLNVEADCLSQGRLVQKWHLLVHIPEPIFQFWGELEVNLLASSHTKQCQYYISLENPLPLGVLGLNASNHPGTYQVNYMFSPSTIAPLILFNFLAEHVREI